MILHFLQLWPLSQRDTDHIFLVITQNYTCFSNCMSDFSSFILSLNTLISNFVFWFEIVNLTSTFVPHLWDLSHKFDFLPFISLFRLFVLWFQFFYFLFWLKIHTRGFFSYFWLFNFFLIFLFWILHPIIMYFELIIWQPIHTFDFLFPQFDFLFLYINLGLLI